MNGASRGCSGRPKVTFSSSRTGSRPCSYECREIILGSQWDTTKGLAFRRWAGGLKSEDLGEGEIPPSWGNSSTLRRSGRTECDRTVAMPCFSGPRSATSGGITPILAEIGGATVDTTSPLQVLDLRTYRCVSGKRDESVRLRPRRRFSCSGEMGSRSCPSGHRSTTFRSPLGLRS